MRTFDFTDYLDALEASRREYQTGYYAMYSSLLRGAVTDPVLMQLPVDDHLVHRGDGVFDTCKVVTGAFYNLNGHLERLVRSAEAIGLVWPGGLTEIAQLAAETVQVSGRRDCAVRIILGRGPGSFGVSPYEPPAPSLYIVAYHLGESFMSRHPEGATVRRSLVPPKPPAFAGVKNCNYLPNVLMKREAQDWGVDFAVGFDPDNHLAEGPTENAGIVTRNGELLFPRLEHVLAGTTMLRVIELAGSLLQSGALKAVAYRDISEADIRDAAEMLMVGTTINVAAVRMYEGRPVGSGQPGPVATALNRLLEQDIHANPAMRTVIPAARA